jgi:hypothetical protein
MGTPLVPESGNEQWPLRLIGRDTIVELDGCLYIVLGFDPMSVTPVTAHLRDLQTGKQRSATLDEMVTPCPTAAGQQSEPERRLLVVA